MNRRFKIFSLILIVLGLMVQGGLLAFYSSTASGFEREAVLKQRLRAGEVVTELEKRLFTIEQIARSTAALMAPIRDKHVAEQALQSMLSSTPTEYVYGIGAWFEPYAFSPEKQYFGPYVHRSPIGPKNIVLTYEWTPPTYAYDRKLWYRAALEGRGSAVFLEPYFDTDFVYMTVAQALPSAEGPPRGVISVDMLLPQIQHLIEEENVSNQESIYLVSREGALLAHPEEQQILEWANAHGRPASSLLDIHTSDLAAYMRERHPGQARYETRATVDKAGWTVVIAIDKGELFSNVHLLHRLMAVASSLLWLSVLGAYTGVQRTMRLEDLTRELERRSIIQETLKESERRLRGVIDTALHAVVGMAEGGRIIDWNPQAEAMFGWTRAEAMGRLVADTIIPEHDRRAHALGLAEYRKTGKGKILNRRVETVALRRDGTEFPVELIMTSVPVEGERLFYAFIADITERRRMERERERLIAEERMLLTEVQRRSAELQATLDSMLDGVVVCDMSGLVTLVNEAALRMLGTFSDDRALSLASLLERLDMARVDGRPFALAELPLSRALAGESVAEEDLSLQSQHRRGRVYLRCSASPVRDGEGRILAAVSVFRDVTEQMELEHLKEQFVKVAAHELKTPVTIMKSYAQLALRQGDALPASTRRIMEAINRGADRIDRIVRDLVDVSQLHLGRLQLTRERVDLREMIFDVVRRTAGAAPKHEIRVHAAESVMILGDPVRLSQVVASLLDNAVRYSPGGGDIDVSLTEEDGEAVIAVEDHGVGIPADKQDRIFELFYRAHSGTPHDYGGLGVGLYIAREIVSQHGGRIRFQSEEGSGSRFVFSIPLGGEGGKVDDERARADRRRRPGPAGCGGDDPRDGGI